MAKTTKTKTKTTTDAAGRPLYLLITEDRSAGYGERYFHLYGRVTTQRYNAEARPAGAHEPYGPDDEYADGPLWNGLRLSCQGDDSSRRRAIEGERDAPVYGFDCLYHDIHSVSRRRAVRMAKTLTQLEAKLEKLTEQRGYVRSYGEYVGRVAEALGCAGIAFERNARSQDVTGQRWQWHDIGYGVNRIDERIQQWVAEAKPAPAAAQDVA